MTKQVDIIAEVQIVHNILDTSVIEYNTNKIVGFEKSYSKLYDIGDHLTVIKYHRVLEDLCLKAKYSLYQIANNDQLLQNNFLVQQSLNSLIITYYETRFAIEKMLCQRNCMFTVLNYSNQLPFEKKLSEELDISDPIIIEILGEIGIFVGFEE